jgi:hypothetical protein
MSGFYVACIKGKVWWIKQAAAEMKKGTLQQQVWCGRYGGSPCEY